VQVRSTVPVVSAHFRSLLRHHARMFTCCKQAFTVVADHWNLIRQPSHVTVQRRKLMGVTSSGWLTGVAGGDWSERADDRPMGGAPVAVTRPRRCHNGWKRTTTIDQLCVAQSRFAAWRGLTSVLSGSSRQQQLHRCSRCRCCCCCRIVTPSCTQRNVVVATSNRTQLTFTLFILTAFSAASGRETIVQKYCQFWK